MLKQIYLTHPDELPKRWVQAWNERNAEVLANLFVEDAEFVNVVGLWWHDRHAIWKAHDYGLKVIFKDSFLELRKVSTRMITDRVALVHARMKLSGQTAFGDVREPSDRKNLFSFILEKRAKGWVCISAHNTDIIPGKETNLINKSGVAKAVDYRNPT